MKLKKKLSISLRKPDTLDGISKYAKRTEKSEVESCDNGHPVIRHRRRNGRDQYYCKICNSYCTDSKTPTSDPSFFDGFITDYIASCLKGQTPKVIKLCDEHKFSRATLYRHLFSKDRKQELAAIVKLCMWRKDTVGSLYKWSINGGELNINHSRGHIELTLIPKVVGGEEGRVSLEGKFSVSVERTPSTGLQFDTERKYFEIPHLDLKKSLRDQLSDLEKILKDQ